MSLVLEARSAIDCVLHPTFCHRLAADPATQQQKLRISPGLCGCPAAIVWTPSAICFRRLVPPPKGPTALIPFHHEAVGTNRGDAGDENISVPAIGRPKSFWRASVTRGVSVLYHTLYKHFLGACSMTDTVLGTRESGLIVI